MEILHWVHENVIRLHVAFGSCGLLLFWIPVVTRKGNLNHKKFGRYFAVVMYAVGFSGITVTTLDLLFPLAMHAPGIALEPARAVAVNEMGWVSVGVSHKHYYHNFAFSFCRADQ